MKFDFIAPENARQSFSAGLSQYRKGVLGQSDVMRSRAAIAERLNGGGEIAPAEALTLALWWAQNTDHLEEPADSGKAALADLMGGRVGRAWALGLAKQVDEERAASDPLTKAISPDIANWISVRWMPFSQWGKDADGNWYDKNTEITREIEPGVLDFHGMAYGGDVRSPGKVVHSWVNDQGRNFDIALDPEHPNFAAYLKAAAEGNLAVSGAYLPGYSRYNAATGYFSHVGISDISLVNRADGKMQKHSASIAVPFSRRDDLNNPPPKNYFLKAQPCAACSKWAPRARAESIHKADGLHVDARLFDNVYSIPANQASPAAFGAVVNVEPPKSNEGRTGRMTIKDMRLKAVNLLKSRFSTLEDNDMLAWLLDVASRGLDDAMQDDGTPAPANAVLKAEPPDEGGDAEQSLKANEPPESAAEEAKEDKEEQIEMDELKKLQDAIAALTAEMAALKSAGAMEKAQPRCMHDAARFQKAVAEFKATPAEEPAFWARFDKACKADEMLKAQPGQTLVDDLWAELENRQNYLKAVMQMPDGAKVLKAVAPPPDDGKQKAEDAQAERELMSGGTFGRQAARQGGK